MSKVFAARLTQAVGIGTDAGTNGGRRRGGGRLPPARPCSLQAKHLVSQLTTPAID